MYILGKYSIWTMIIVFCLQVLSVSYAGAQESQDLSSGPRTLLFVSNNMGISKDLREIRTLIGYTKETGPTMLDIYQAALHIGLPAVPLEVNIDQLCSIEGYKIVVIKGNRYFIVHNCEGDELILQDPPGPTFPVSKIIFQKQWDGVVLVFSQKIKDQLLQQKVPFKIADLVIKGPSIHFEETLYNFGITQEGDILSHTFIFTNTGVDTLEIDPRATCHCTTALSSGNRIPPGGSGEIQVEFDTTGRKINGITTESVLVRSNDPENKYTKIEVRAIMRYNGGK